LQAVCVDQVGGDARRGNARSAPMGGSEMPQTIEAAAIADHPCMPVACPGDVEHQSSTARWLPRFEAVVAVASKLCFTSASERRTGTRRRRIAELSFPRSRRGRCRPTDRSERRGIRALPAFFARLRTADHRQFRPSKDQCFGSPLRAPACRSQCRRIAIVHPDAGRDKSPRRPSACRRKDSPHRC
jgi:hypothetical protein